MSGQGAAGRRFDDPDRGRDAAGAPETVPTTRNGRAESPLPLVIDLDAHLPEGIAWEAALCALRARPGAALALAAQALRGRAALERAACRLAGAELAAIPLDPSCLAAARQAQAEGRPVILLTAAHAALAEALQRAHPFVVGTIAAEGADAVAGLARAAAVWARCPAGFVVLPGRHKDAAWARNASALPALPDDAEEPTAAPTTRRLWARALRLHQWTKNLLVFVPLVLAGRALDPAAWMLAGAAFLAFGLAASATYLLNDLHDLAHDRAHRSKRHRPLASGALPIPQALAAAAAGLAACIGLASAGGAAGAATLAAYLGLTLAYTFAIKRHAVLDTVTLGALFTLRLAGGIAFCGVAASPWLLAFSMFVFTSLALGKRFVEIDQIGRSGRTAVAGRGYVAKDAPAVLALGAATSTAAVLILSLYIFEAPARSAFYVRPELLWAAPVALFLWLGRIWLLCGRGDLRDDPVEFALTDRASHVLGLVIVISFALACLPF